jgi:excinuclease UvrABC ATPase subunit
MQNITSTLQVLMHDFQRSHMFGNHFHLTCDKKIKYKMLQCTLFSFVALLCLVFGCVGMGKARWRIIDTILHYGSCCCRGAIGAFSGSTVEPDLSLFCI